MMLDDGHSSSYAIPIVKDISLQLHPIRRVKMLDDQKVILDLLF